MAKTKIGYSVLNKCIKEYEMEKFIKDCKVNEFNDLTLAVTRNVEEEERKRRIKESKDRYEERNKEARRAAAKKRYELKKAEKMNKMAEKENLYIQDSFYVEKEEFDKLQAAISQNPIVKPQSAPSKLELKLKKLEKEKAAMYRLKRKAKIARKERYAKDKAKRQASIKYKITKALKGILNFIWKI